MYHDFIIASTILLYKNIMQSMKYYTYMYNYIHGNTFRSAFKQRIEHDKERRFVRRKIEKYKELWINKERKKGRKNLGG